MEIEIAISEAEEGFDPVKDILTIRNIIDDHASLSPPISSPILAAKQDALLADQFTLLMKQLQYDQEAFKTWSRKCQTARASAYYKEMEFKLSAQGECKEAFVMMVMFIV